MTKQVQWSRVLVEGVVIVVSILLAFGIEAGWSARQATLEERANLQALLTDMDEVIAEAELRIAQDEATIVRVSLIADSLRNQATIPDSALAGLLFRVANHRVIRASLDAYTDLVSSGGISTIKDPDLRRLLARARYDLDLANRVNEQNSERHGDDFVSILDLAASGSSDLNRRLALYAELNNRSRRFYIGRKTEALIAARAAREAILEALEPS